MNPVGNKVKAIRLMGRGNQRLQAGEGVLTHRAGCGGEEQVRRQVAQIGIRIPVARSLPDHAPEGVGDIIAVKLLPDGVVLHVQPGLQHSLHNLIGLCFFDASQRGHNRHLQLRRFGRRGALRGNLIPAPLCLEELPVLLEGFPQGGRLRNLHLVHPHGDLIRPEFLAVKRHIQQPVVFLRIIGQRAIDQVVAGWVVRRQQLLGIEVIAASQLQHFGIVEGEPVDLLLELPILVIPDDNPAFVEFRQGSRKLAVQVLNDLVSVHTQTS